MDTIFGKPTSTITVLTQKSKGPDAKSSMQLIKEETTGE